MGFDFTPISTGTFLASGGLASAQAGDHASRSTRHAGVSDVSDSASVPDREPETTPVYGTDSDGGSGEMTDFGGSHHPRRAFAGGEDEETDEDAPPPGSLDLSV